MFNTYITIIMAFQGRNIAAAVNMVALMRFGKASLFQCTVYVFIIVFLFVVIFPGFVILLSSSLALAF